MEELIKICALSTCGKEFKTKDKRRKYCSETCAKIARKEQVKLVQRKKIVRYKKCCEICGRLYVTYKKSNNTCSKACEIEYREYIKNKKRKPTAEEFIHKRLNSIPTLEHMTAAELLYYGKTQAQYYPVTVDIPTGLKKAKEQQQ